jgi:hypothetical protein
MIELLYEALASEWGIAVETSDPDRLKQRLYAERRKAADPALDALSLVTSPFNPGGELWIVNRSNDDGEAPRGPGEGDAEPLPR